jgi:hypothetical protein
MAGGLAGMRAEIVKQRLCRARSWRQNAANDDSGVISEGNLGSMQQTRKNPHYYRSTTVAGQQKNHPKIIFLIF